MAGIRLEQVTKQFPDGTRAVDDLTLDIADGEFMVLVGPSGSGKSTALRIVSGLETLTSGRVRIGERVVNTIPPRDRDIAMVFQNYALYPHMSVFENMAFGLKLRKVAKDQVRKRVENAASIMGISDLLGRKPRQLSGGQRQRVAMGRAIVREPAAFLMDEPLSNLDAKLRVQMRAEIAALHQRLGTTTMYVTHDQTEAMTMGDRIAVLRRGALQQVDTPQVLYDEPVNLFVAGFIGSPAMNFVRARIEAHEGRAYAVFGSHRLRVADDNRALAERAGQDLVLGIRPEDIDDAELTPPAGPDEVIEITIGLAEPMGAEVVVHFDVDVAPVVTEDTKELAVEDDTGLDHAEKQGKTPFTARLSPRTQAARNTAMKLVIDTTRLYAFDPSTGRAVR